MKKSLITLLGLCAALFVAAPLQAKVAVGDTAPDFTLTDLDGNEHSLSDFRGKVTVVEFTNPGCPFVVKFYKPGAMQKFQKEAMDDGVVWLVVNPTVSSHGDFLDKEASKAWVATHNIKAPWLINDDSSVAKTYGAARTPELFVIDKEGKIVYMGAIDSISSASADDIEKADNYVMKALEQLDKGEAVTISRTRPYGCTIKF